MKVPILCYHKVGTEESEGRRLNIDPSRLDSHVRYFLRRGFQFVRASDLTDWPAEPTVCFTFDDGYVSTFESGQPVFDRNRVSMTVYVVSNLVGKSSQWDGEHARPLADWNVLLQAQEMGHEIGNHTANHVFMGKSTGEVQRNEVLECQNKLREQGIEPRSFCYPYGSLDAFSPSLLTEFEVNVGMALGKRCAVESDDRLRLPRIVVAYSDALPMLIYKLRIKPLLQRSA